MQVMQSNEVGHMHSRLSELLKKLHLLPFAAPSVFESFDKFDNQAHDSLPSFVPLQTELLCL